MPRKVGFLSLKKRERVEEEEERIITMGMPLMRRGGRLRSGTGARGHPKTASKSLKSWLNAWLVVVVVVV